VNQSRLRMRMRMLINVVLKNNQSRVNVSTRVLVRPIGVDMVEVGGSTPPGPTKFLSLCFYLSLFFRIARFGAFLCVDTTAER